MILYIYDISISGINPIFSSYKPTSLSWPHISPPSCHQASPRNVKPYDRLVKVNGASGTLSALVGLVGWIRSGNISS